MKQRLYIAATERAEQAKAVAVRTGEAVQNARAKALTYAAVGVGSLVAASGAFAQGTTGGGSGNLGQTYGLGQAGSPAPIDYFNAAQGFNSSLAPLLSAILPVLVVILAIWQGPKLLKRLTTMMAH